MTISISREPGPPAGRAGTTSSGGAVPPPPGGAEPDDGTGRSPLQRLERIRAGVLDGDPDASARQREKGKLTVRERLELLFDPGTFTELQPMRRHRASAFGLERHRPYTDGVVTGWGEVFGRTVYVYAHDQRIFGGTLGEANAEKIHKVMDLAIAARAPLIGLSDGGGARIQEGVLALTGYGGIFRRHALASGVIPQISVVVGPCAGGAAYAPALTDFVFMVRATSQMFVTGPNVVAAVTGEVVSVDDLGGADVHAGTSGVATFLHDDEPSCLEEVRYLLSLLPSTSGEMPPSVPPSDPVDRRTERLRELVPEDNASGVYDMKLVIAELVDDGEFVELQQGWARNLVCVLARIGGRVVGILANQPACLAGTLDIDASDKGGRFVQFCDAFNIPLVTLLDVPGFLPGVEQEHNGIIRHGAKLLYAYCVATVPRIQVILRKAYGGAYIVMDSLSVGADLSYAWPANEIAVMGPEGAAEIIFRKEIAAADDPPGRRAELIAQYRAELMHPLYAAEHGLVDDVIDPADTRKALARALVSLQAKNEPLPLRKHGNPPT